MRLKQFLPLALTGLAILFGYFAGRCGISGGSCFFSAYFNDYVFSVLEPLYIFSLYSVPAVFLLPIVKERVFKTWLRFATVWIILSVIVISSTATSSQSWFPIYEFIREDAAKVMGVLFSGLSLILLAKQTFLPKKVREAKL
ncbi:MAG: hypothetical protein QG636_305 [Patescibacteria group bacterium]|nr:hypothetical protein [Patescibacteria group bacterium]